MFWRFCWEIFIFLRYFLFRPRNSTKITPKCRKGSWIHHETYPNLWSTFLNCFPDLDWDLSAVWSLIFRRNHSHPPACSSWTWAPGSRRSCTCRPKYRLIFDLCGLIFDLSGLIFSLYALILEDQSVRHCRYNPTILRRRTNSNVELWSLISDDPQPWSRSIDRSGTPSRTQRTAPTRGGQCSWKRELRDQRSKINFWRYQQRPTTAGLFFGGKIGFLGTLPEVFWDIARDRKMTN